jgi:alkylation response protein AidB-like acyl-CoA dehydrogenase
VSWVFDETDDQRRLLSAVGELSATARARDDGASPAGFDAARWQALAKSEWISAVSGALSDEPEPRRQARRNAVVLLSALAVSLQPEPYLETVVAAAVLDALAGTAGHRELATQVACGQLLAAWCFPGGAWPAATVGSGAGAQVRLRGGGAGALDGRVRAVAAAAAADYFVVTASAPDGWRVLLIPATAPGVRVTPLESMDLTRRYGDVLFEAADASAAALISEPLPGPAVDDMIGLATLLQCAESVGIAGRCLDLTCEYTKGRYAFGRAVASYQAVKHRLATMYLQLEASRAITWAAAGASRGDADEPWLNSAAKAYVADASCSIVEESMQLHGGVAFTWDNDLHLLLRRVRTERARFASPAAHRGHIARAVGLDNILTSVFGG